MDLNNLNKKIIEENKPRLCPEPVEAGKWFHEEIEQPEPILEGLFDKSSKILLAGASKAMKSFFLLQLCIAIASGLIEFLKWKIHKKRKVLLVQVEITPGHFQKRYKRLLNVLEIAPEDVDGHLYFIHGRGSIPFEPVAIKQFFDDIADYAKQYQIELICIDPVYKFIFNESAAEDWKPLLYGLDTLINVTGASVLYVHHYAKGYASDKQTIDRTSGSGVIGRDMDCSIFIDSHKDEDLKVIESIQRNYKPTEPFSCSVENTVFRLEATPAILKSRNDIQNKKRPEVSEEFALNYFIKSAQPKKCFKQWLKDFSSVSAADSLIDKLIHSGKLTEHWKGRGQPKMIGTPTQIKELNRLAEESKKPKQEDLSI